MRNETIPERYLLVRAVALDLAEAITRRMVKLVRVADGALLLGTDPSWAGAINMVLVSKGARVSELVGKLRNVAGLPSRN